MPHFSHIEGFDEEVVGFLLPVFRPFPGSNETLIQQIGSDGLVEGFTEVDTPTVRILYPTVPTHLEAVVGQPAIWAFCVAPGHIVVASYADMQALGLELLKNGKLAHTPLVAAEMAMWCEPETLFPQIFIKAYASLSKESEISAACWRDVTVLLPQVKRDLRAMLPATPTNDRLINDTIAYTRGNELLVYLNTNVQIDTKGLKKTTRLAGVFGIRHVSFSKIYIEQKGPLQKPIPEEVKSGLPEGVVLYADERFVEVERQLTRLSPDNHLMVLPDRRNLFNVQLPERMPAYVIYDHRNVDVGLNFGRQSGLVGIDMSERRETQARNEGGQSFAKVIEIDSPTTINGPRGGFNMSAAATAILLDYNNRYSPHPTPPGYRVKYMQVTGLGHDPMADAWAQLYEKVVSDYRLLSGHGLFYHFSRSPKQTAERSGQWAKQIFFPDAQLTEIFNIRSYHPQRRPRIAALLQTSDRGYSFQFAPVVSKILDVNGWKYTGDTTQRIGSDFRIENNRLFFDCTIGSDIPDRLLKLPSARLDFMPFSEIKQLWIMERANAGAILHHLANGILAVTIRDLLCFLAQPGTIWTLLGPTGTSLCFLRVVSATNPLLVSHFTRSGDAIARP